MVGGEKLTSKQAAALQEELEQLEGPRRTEIVAAIKTAREFGDLSENFEYHAAKNEQGLLEARIRTLRARLESAEIVEGAAADEVGVGSVVDIEGDGGQKLTVEISAVGGIGITLVLPEQQAEVSRVARLQGQVEAYEEAGLQLAKPKLLYTSRRRGGRSKW